MSVLLALFLSIIWGASLENNNYTSINPLNLQKTPLLASHYINVSNTVRHVKLLLYFIQKNS